MSSILRNKFDYLAENLFPQLIVLIPNSAKVMASSAHAAIRLIIKVTVNFSTCPVGTKRQKNVHLTSITSYITLDERWNTAACRLGFKKYERLFTWILSWDELNS